MRAAIETERDAFGQFGPRSRLGCGKLNVSDFEWWPQTHSQPLPPAIELLQSHAFLLRPQSWLSTPSAPPPLFKVMAHLHIGSFISQACA